MEVAHLESCDHTTTGSVTLVNLGNKDMKTLVNIGLVQCDDTDSWLTGDDSKGEHKSE